MRKNATKIAALALSLALTMTSVNIPTNASAASVKLNKKKATLYVSGAKTKKTTTLKVTGTKKKVTFTSNKKSVATVNSKGKVTAKKAGKATITAKVGKKSYKCTITVKKTYKPVTSLTVSPKSVTLEVGKTKTIKATVKPAKPTEKGVTYKSSKTSVATVSSKGKITAKKAGSAKITVTTKGATKTASNKKATIAVTVKKAATTPSAAPSTNPSDAPSTNPSDTPTDTPTDTPSESPSAVPTELAEMVDATAKAPDTIVATFAADVPADTEITVADKDGKAVESASVTKEGATATFVAKSKFTPGTYTITAKLGEASSSKDVVVEAEKVTEIKVTSTQALLKAGDKKTAIAYYDVYNQYGTTMRSSTSITWTASTGKVTANKTTGRLEIKKDGTEDFTYGQKLYLVGVDAKGGNTCQAELPIGLEQAVNSVEFEGFLNIKGDTTKVLKELPANFPEGTYVMLYTTKDQDNQTMDAALHNIEGETVSGAAVGASLTFTSNNPMVVDGSKIKDGAIYTIGDKEYSSATIEPGMYADQGGEVEILVISNKTGQSSKINFTVGDAPRLQSFIISEPAGTIADGDKYVDIPYVATDTKGNTIKNYETIVRSTNKLILNAGEGYIHVEENNDGTARFYWNDKYGNTTEEKLAGPLDGLNFSMDSAFNGQDRKISISATVTGGEGSNIVLSVSDMRRPTTIDKIKLNEDDADALVSNGEASVDILTDTVTYRDQYGEKLAKEKAEAFFKQTAMNAVEGSFNGVTIQPVASHKYGIKVVAPSTNGLTVENKVYSGVDNTISFTAGDVSNIKSSNVKYAIVEYSSSDEAWNEVDKALTVSYTIVPITSLTDLSITSLNKQKILTTNSNNPNYAVVTSGAAITDAIDTDIPIKTAGDEGDEFSVKGKYGTKTLSVPKAYCEAVTSGAFGYEPKASDSYKWILKNVNSGELNWSELYDANSARLTRIDATKSLSVKVYDTKDTTMWNNTHLLSTPKANVKLSDALSVPTEVSFKKGDKVTVRTGNGEDNGYQLKIWIGNWDYADFEVKVLDQYGKEMDKASYNIEYAISNIVQNEGEFAHLPNSFAVSKNNSEEPVIDKAEINDTFKVTATVTMDNSSVSISKDIQATVGSDKDAKIGNGFENDKNLRKLLGYSDR